ncbi:hypothetical protein XSR1_210042 [Xenorhabdus szentirmaii DSM 16338]|uniref:Uncharacterized protein n=1 Tax=Xenorhabdus szentirmaii DSM 16338 TaxID=1427518 RepID=W1IY96_9GAMM|nr:hypothetical protein XSR1_210042 [Xenorhabdus szentirmaii DSM 16338]
MVINNCSELLSVKLTPENADGREPVNKTVFNRNRQYSIEKCFPDSTFKTPGIYCGVFILW